MNKTRDSNPAGKFRGDIEGLRAIAVMVVIFFHCGLPGVRGGFVGVDIFFVLSGYLITGLLLADLQASGTLNMVRFYARRTRRLLPVSLLVLLVTILTARIILPPLDQDTLWKSAFATACYNSNNFFALSSGDYFGHALASNPFLHTWSLAVEEQFYLVWPLLLLIFCKISRNKKTLGALLLLLCVLSLGLCIWLTYRANYLAFFLAAARGWEFGLGGLASLIPDTWLRQRPRLAIASGIAGILVLILSVMFIREEMAFPGWIA